MDNQQSGPKWTNNKTIYTVVVILVLALIVGLYLHSRQQNANQTNLNQSNSLTSITATPTIANPTPTPTAAPKLSYADAIKAYPERFQFLLCQGTPAVIAVRKGTPVMLDNRNAVAYTIKADTQTFNIAGYGYEIFYPEVLGNLVVDCNGKPSVTLNVEK